MSAPYGRGWNGRRGGTVTVWVTVLVSVLGEAAVVLGATDVVPVSVLGGGAVSVMVSVGVPPPPPWCRGASEVVVAGAVVDGVVVAGLCAGERVASVITANTSAASRITPIAPAAISAAGRRYQGVGGSGSGPRFPAS
ncbi:MAG TPA: hypothetical protein VGI49_06840 [Mycobacterium sp.]|jgi:hypothetical protein